MICDVTWKCAMDSFHPCLSHILLNKMAVMPKEDNVCHTCTFKIYSELILPGKINLTYFVLKNYTCNILEYVTQTVTLFQLPSSFRVLRQLASSFELP